jgi:hypothetical protein
VILSSPSPAQYNSICTVQYTCHCVIQPMIVILESPGCPLGPGYFCRPSWSCPVRTEQYNPIYTVLLVLSYAVSPLYPE